MKEGHIDAVDEVLAGSLRTPLRSSSAVSTVRGSGLVELVSGTVPVPAKVNAIHEATPTESAVRARGHPPGVTKDRLDREGRIGIAIPHSVRAVIRRRLAPLSAACSRVLSAAAVVGRDFDIRVVGLASEIANDRVLRSMSEAVALGYERTGGARLPVLPPPDAEVLHEDLPYCEDPAASIGRGGDRARARRRPAAPAAQLAHHFARAVPAGGGELALDYARRGAIRRWRTSAYEEAVGQYRRGPGSARIRRRQRGPVVLTSSEPGWWLVGSRGRV